MADQQTPQRSITAPFPAPPPFWKQFTTENLSRLEAITNSALPESTSTKNAKKQRLEPTELRALKDVPEDLAFLIPPTPPTTDSYTVFSENITLTSDLPSLPSQHLPQLFEPTIPTNPAPHLLKLTKSVILNFLELSSTLSLNPSSSPEKLEDIRNIYLNIHHLINLYRPHQARETLVRMLEERVEEGRKEVENMEGWESRVIEWFGQIEGEGKRAEEELKESQRSIQTNGHVSANGVRDHVSVYEAKEIEDARKLWKMINEIEIEENGNE